MSEFTHVEDDVKEVVQDVAEEVAPVVAEAEKVEGEVEADVNKAVDVVAPVAEVLDPKLDLTHLRNLVYDIEAKVKNLTVDLANLTKHLEDL